MEDSKMKIILIISIIAICVYLGFLSLALTKYKYVTFTDIDLNQNGILAPSEIDYILNSKVRYRCYTDNIKYVYSEILPNKKEYKKIILEVFSLKDGLPIKEILIK